MKSFFSWVFNTDSLKSWFRLDGNAKAEWGFGVALIVGVGLGLLTQAGFFGLIELSPDTFSDQLGRISSGLLITVAGVLPILAYLTIKNLKISSSLLLDKFKLNYFWRLAIATLVYLILMIAGALLVFLFTPDALDVEQDVGFTAGASLSVLVVGFITLSIVVPIVEEIIFRGFLFRGVAKSTNFLIAAVATSALFGLAHVQLAVAVDTFMLGLVSCALIARTGSLWPSIMLHSLKNTLAFFLLFVLPTL